MVKTVSGAPRRKAMTRQRSEPDNDSQRWHLPRSTGLEMAPFAGEHLDAAAEMMAANYRRERLLDPALPARFESAGALRDRLRHFADGRAGASKEDSLWERSSSPWRTGGGGYCRGDKLMSAAPLEFYACRVHNSTDAPSMRGCRPSYHVP